MLSEKVQRYVIARKAELFINPVHKSALVESVKGEKPFFGREIFLINKAIRIVNQLLADPGEEQDSDLENIYNGTYPLSELPLVFSASTKA